MTNLKIMFKRLVIVIWFPLFLILVFPMALISPLGWVITGKWAVIWLMNDTEPFGLAEKWGLTKK